MYYILLFTVPILFLIGLYCYKRNRKKKGTDKIEMNAIAHVEVEKAGEEEKQETQPERLLRTSHDLSKQCIHLLGDFMVKDKNGEDISTLFTPNLRSLLTMLILYTEDNPDGIPGDIIVQTLWRDKNKYAARNNRNVSLTKLRNILENVGQISITNQGNNWKITFGEDVLCDYCEVITYFHTIKENKYDDEFHLNILLDLLHRGALLRRIHWDWLDSYKRHFSYQSIKLLTSLLRKPLTTNEEFKIKIANTLLQHDHLSEEALRVQCHLLHKLGKIEQMKSCYSEFRTIYSNLLGITYKKTLREILRERTH